MERRTHFGFGGRPSGIRPPSAYKSNQPKALTSTSSVSSIPSSTSSRKNQNNALLFNFPGSGGSRASRQSNAGPSAGARQSVFGNFRSNMLSSGRKSVTAKIGPLFGLTPQHNRASYQPNTCSSAQSSRRSSMGGNRHVKDSRPLSDTNYHRSCANKLIEFLTKNGYSHPISKNFSTRPTVGEVSKIFEFLFYFFGSKAKTTPMDTEIPKVMASLEYPFPVKKSDLVSFTNGRALGSVLGMLEWLVDSLTYGSNMDPIRTFYPNFEGEIDVKHELINFCLTSNEEEFDSEQLDSQLNDLIVRTYGTEDDFEQMLDEQQMLEQEVQRLDDEIQQIRDLPQTIQTYESDIKNYDNYSQEMSAHMKANQQILESLQNEKTEKLANVRKMEEQKKQLKCQVEEQEFGLEEAVLARERKQQLEDEIKQESEIIDDIRKSIRMSRLDCSKYEDTIRKMESDLDSFITAMTDLVNSPVMSNYSSNLRALVADEQWMQILSSLKSFKIGETNGTTNGTNISELEKLFSHRVHSLKIAIVQQLSSLKGSVSLTELQKLNQLNSLVEEMEKQLTLSVKQVEQLVSQMETQRKEQVSQIASLQSECDRTRQLLNEFDGNTKRSHKEVKQNLLELRKQVEEKETLCETEQKAMTKEFETTVSNHKKGLQEFSSNLDSFIAEEKSKTTQLESVLAKTGANADVAKDRKTRGRRDRNGNKENK